MRPPFPLILLLALLPAIHAMAKDPQCFWGFAGLSADEDGFFELVGKTYAELLTTDRDLKRGDLEKLLAAEDLFTPGTKASPLLRKRLRDFRTMVESRGANPARVHAAMRAYLTELVARLKQGEGRERAAVRDAGPEPVVKRTIELSEAGPIYVFGDPRWVFQRAAPPERLDRPDWYVLTYDTLTGANHHITMTDTGLSFPTLSPDGKEMLFVETEKKIFHRIPFVNGKVDFSAAKKYGPFPVSASGEQLTWMPGAEPHLLIGGTDGGRNVEPFQYNWKTNVAIPLKGDPPFLPEKGTGEFSRTSRPGYLQILRSAPHHEIAIYRVAEDGSAKLVGEPVRSLSWLTGSTAVFDKRAGDGFVLTPPSVRNEGKFSLQFVGFQGKRNETVHFPELDRSRGFYHVEPHPTRNGLLVATEDRNVQTGSDVWLNQVYWVDLETRKVSRVALGSTVGTNKDGDLRYFFSADGEEIAVRSGKKISFIDFFSRVLE